MEKLMEPNKIACTISTWFVTLCMLIFVVFAVIFISFDIKLGVAKNSDVEQTAKDVKSQYKLGTKRIVWSDSWKTTIKNTYGNITYYYSLQCIQISGNKFGLYLITITNLGSGIVRADTSSNCQQKAAND